jgi:hypothetical protein
MVSHLVLAIQKPDKLSRFRMVKQNGCQSIKKPENLSGFRMVSHLVLAIRKPVFEW